jgi:hypothetical protein
MTPDDFLRSMTPGIKQPDGKGIIIIIIICIACSNSAFVCTFVCLLLLEVSKKHDLVHLNLI